ncbi:hypothetical protein [Calothrix rhizosoleniae]|uniref:hypothetical protein n=1 Tax=Calothrix rhizosoleniae TaxID=888997 RepID=UPI000B49A35C|nr:hypothetical protein [Calothrix rhizosoleniae]
MNNFIEALNNYAALINVALFATILGFLFRLSNLSRTYLRDKYGAELAARDANIAALQAERNSLSIRLDSRTEQLQGKLDVLEYQLAYFQRIADLPDDKRVEAIKYEYESKIKKLEIREAELEEESTEKEKLRQELDRLRSDAKQFIKIDKLYLDTALKIIPKIVNIVGF